ncbi:thioredoxin-like protein [Trametes polyzona]|nr:thioredoxin-like protein [Trametes polyzona]
MLSALSPSSNRFSRPGVLRALKRPRTLALARRPHLNPAISLALATRLTVRRSPLGTLAHTRAFFSSPSTSSSDMSEAKSFYDLKAELPGGKTYDFEQLKGKVVLIVNVASKCGFTPQYKGLQALYDKYKDRGFVILGFPCNQFGGQEPESDDKIAQFCELNHGVTFPLMAKSDVNGDGANEVYKWLKERKAGLLGLTRIKWNFEKFLIDREGKVVHRWASTTSPEAIDAEVAKLL